MGNVILAYPAGGPYTATVTLRAGSFVSDHPQLLPIQLRQVAESGKAFVFILHQNVETIYGIRVVSLQQDDDAEGFSGRDSLVSFLQSTVKWHRFTFDFTDADGDLDEVRYWAGIETLQEQQRKALWNGTLTLRKEI